jgi:hypothetical protein
VNFTFSSGDVYGRPIVLGFKRFSDGPDGGLKSPVGEFYKSLPSLGVSFTTSSSGLNSRRFQKS